MMNKQILQYKIIEKLGEGGMAEIYKALDTYLERIVALKFLPSYISITEEVKTRFLKEAKAASSLSHPNICTIHAIHEVENDEGIKQLFIVMEYVEGETLKNLKKDLSVKQIIEIGIQIAEGLAAAHQKGIIHRDIKPENIMIRKDGRIQIMDFGLAKLSSAGEVSRLTKVGTTMGTLGYISPEQVQGFDVDFRTDLFSTGIVLYELLTGGPPFSGLHDAEVIYKIINSDVLPASSMRNDIDPLLDLVILKCLEKDRGKRYQSSFELAEDLKNLKHLYEKEHVPIEKLRKKLLNRVKPRRRTTISPSGSIKIERSLKGSVWAGVTFLILIIIILYKALLTENPYQLNPDMKIQELVTSFTDISIPSISSDGNWIAFPASDQNDKWDIYLMHSSVKQPAKVTKEFASYIHYAVISPDGGEILYNIENNLFIIPSTGGIAEKIAENVVSCGWRPDGKQIGYVVEHYPDYNSIGFWTMNPDGSDKKLIFTDRWKINGRFSFSYSPDGNSILTARFFDEGYDELFIKDLNGGKETQLTFDKANIEDQEWTKKGLILYTSNKSGNTNLWAIPETGGASFQITKGNGPDLEISASSDLSRILYYQLRDFSNLWIGNPERSKYKQITFDERLITDPAVSPDHKKIAFCLHRTAPVLSTSIFIMDKDGTNLRQLTFDNYRNEYPVFSPDGKFLSYTQYRINKQNDNGRAFVVDLKSSEPPRSIGEGRAGIWLNNSSLVLIKKAFTEAVSIDGIKKENIFRDSTFAYPVISGKYLFYLDMHSKNSGKYFSVENRNDNPTIYSPLYLFSINDYVQTIINPNYVYAQDFQNEVWRFSYSSGKKEKVGYFVNLMTYWGSGFNISSDDKEIVYLEHKRSTKFVMIQNAFAESKSNFLKRLGF